MSDKKPILIYHANCPDGFGAAYAFWKKYSDDIEYAPISYDSGSLGGLRAEDLVGRKIWMADVSFSREETIEVQKNAEEFLLLDHHITAKDSLSDLDYCKFDIEHSGAVMAWNYCFPGKNIPKLLSYIEDRDLWKLELPDSKEILSAIDAVERTFPNWERLRAELDSKSGYEKLCKSGSTILEYNSNLIKRIKEGAYYGVIKGYTVPMINIPFFRTEIVTDLAIGNDFAAGYHYDGNKFIVSLRSDSEGRGVDVSKIAQSFGGGGHKHAAGFVIDTLNGLEV